MIDSRGLVTRDRLHQLAAHKRDFAQDAPTLTGLTEVIQHVRLSVLIGVSGQCNNMYIFPGVGLGTVTFEVSTITDSMFSAAAHTLAEQVDEQVLASGSLFPDLCRIREISARIAVAVGEVAYREGLAGVTRPHDLLAHVQPRMFQPRYLPYQAV